MGFVPAGGTQKRGNTKENIVTIRRLLHTCLILSLVGISLLLTNRAALAKAPSVDLETTIESGATSVEGPSGSVLAWRLNVRSGPGTSYRILTTVSYREKLSLTGRTADSSWLCIRRNDGQQGWVSAHYVAVSGAHRSAVSILDGSQPPQVPPSSAIAGHVTAYRLNVRSGPGMGNTVITRLREGQPVTPVGRDISTTWLQIDLPDAKQGWVSARYIGSSFMLEVLPITGGAVPNPIPGATGTVTAIKLNVRSGPSLAHGIMGWVYNDQQVQLVGRNSASTWLKITLAPGFDGWVSAAFITANYPITSLPVVD